MKNTALLIEIDRRGVAFVRLNRPRVHNAFDDKLIAQIDRAFLELEENPLVRMAVLSGKGKSFCAGGDLNWMKSMKNYSREENLADGARLAGMYTRLHRFSKPLVGMVHGAALGGGSGLAAVCDYVVAAEDARFGFTETRLGLVPATIAPYVVAKIGASAARAYFISGAVFSASVAKDIGLVHRIVPADHVMGACEETIAEFLKAGPQASRNAKALIHEVLRLGASGADTKALTDYTVGVIAQMRISAEAQEGMAALLEGRAPGWKAPA